MSVKPLVGGVCWHSQSQNKCRYIVSIQRIYTRALSCQIVFFTAISIFFYWESVPTRLWALCWSRYAPFSCNSFLNFFLFEKHCACSLGGTLLICVTIHSLHRKQLVNSALDWFSLVFYFVPDHDYNTFVRFEAIHLLDSRQYIC